MTTFCGTPQRHVEHCMGTLFSIDVRAPGVDHVAVNDVVTWLHWVDATFSTYRTDSQISRLGRGAITLTECAPEVTEVLERCAELGVETNGYFDCQAGGWLDPSGYVRGWAIERAGDLLIKAGSENHCINGGGDVQCLGAPSDGNDWQIGIADPVRPGEVIATISGSTLAIATSSTAERGRHITDPHTGVRPAVFAGITVVGPTLGVADAYATAAFAMGSDAEHWLVANGVSALLVEPDGRTISTFMSPT